MNSIRRTLHGADALAGPLLRLRAVPGAALGEWVEIRCAGQADRRGQVIEASDTGIVVQVLEETIGLRPGDARVTFTGEVAMTAVGRELFGRVLSGTGAPLDGLPPPIGTDLRPIAGAPMNPTRRSPPADFIETGISAIDGMNTLVRGQKLPVFCGPGMPGLELAARIVEWARAPGDQPFAVIFVGIGITDRETRSFLARFEGSAALERTVFYLNQTRDPTIERLLVPRVALTQAEHLAFDEGIHVLVVIADVLHYCEALREVAAARDEIPARQGYPGSMYTDLAALFERAGIFEGRQGSITQIPIVTMPDDDITHPIPDLTGYITEGQIVLSRELGRRAVFPPVDVLPSLSRLMNRAIGPGRTVPEHREWSNQLYAIYARGREARLTAAIVGEAGLDEGDRRALHLADRFEREFIGQGERRRSIEETIAAGWALIDEMPREELVRISEKTWQAHVGAKEVSP